MLQRKGNVFKASLELFLFSAEPFVVYLSQHGTNFSEVHFPSAHCCASIGI